jgi:DHA3 family macrolide efflux protein-like MFS transporter
LAIDVITALLAILPMCFIAIPQSERIEQQRSQSTLWGDFKAGFSYLGCWPGLFIISLMTEWSGWKTTKPGSSYIWEAREKDLVNR